MKDKLTLFAALIATHSISMGEIVINDHLAVEGFADMSYAHLNKTINPVDSPGKNKEENNFRIDEVEISFIAEFEPVYAQLDIDYEEDGDGLEVKQAFVTYDFENMSAGSAVTAGRYASMLGFEAFVPTGLYQYSTAYGGSVINDLLAFATDVPAFFESVFFPIGERYTQGVRYTFEEGNTFLGISIQESTVIYENRFGEENDSDNVPVDDGGYGIEVAYEYSFPYGLTFFLGGTYENGDGMNTPGQTTEDTETYILNTYVTLELGAWLFAAEFNYSETEVDQVSTLSGLNAQIESVTSLIMANYAYNERASITGRISYMDLNSAIEEGPGDLINLAAFKYTAAHNYALTDNVFIIAELSYTEGDYEAPDTNGNVDELLLAAALLVTF